MSANRRKPAMPPVPAGTPTALRPFLSSVREALQVSLGQGRGSGLDAAVTFRDLKDGKVPSIVLQGLGNGGSNNGNGNGGGGNPDKPVEHPTTPLNVKAKTVGDNILLTWTGTQTYSGHSHTEIFLQQTVVVDGKPVDPPGLNLSEMLFGTAVGGSVALNVQALRGYYVFLRFVNDNGVAGNIHSGAGTYIFVNGSAESILEQISGQINESTLAQDLKDKIGQVALIPPLQDKVNDALVEIGGIQSGLDDTEAALGQVAGDLEATADELRDKITETEGLIGQLEVDLGDGVDASIMAGLELVMALSEEAAHRRLELHNEKDGAFAGIKEVQQTVVDTDAALAEVESSLTAKIGEEVEALDTSLRQVIATEDSALSQRIDQVGVRVGEAEAGIEETKQAVADTNSAMTSMGSELNASIGDTADALDTSLRKVIADADSALSQRIDTMGARVGDAEAAIESNKQTIAQTDMVMGQMGDRLTAKINDDVEALNESLSKVIATEDLALSQRMDTLTSKVNDNAAGIVTNAQAVTDTKNAMSLMEERLEASVDGVDSKLQQTSQVVASIDENGTKKYSAQWGIKTEVDGLVGGVGFYNDGKKTQFLVNAQQFAVLGQGEDTTNPFIVQDGKVYINAAYINKATIDELVTNYLVANEIEAIKIRGGTIDIGDGNFTVSGAGSMVAKNADVEGVIKATSGYFKGRIESTDGFFKGSVYANKIVGDIVAAKSYDLPELEYTYNSLAAGSYYKDIFSFSVNGNHADFLVDRVVILNPIAVEGFVRVTNKSLNERGASASMGVYIEILKGTTLVASVRVGGVSVVANDFLSESDSFQALCRPVSFAHPKGTGRVTYKVRFRVDSSTSKAQAVEITASMEAQRAIAQLFSNNSQLA